MAVTPVLPSPLTVNAIVTGGAPVVAVPANAAGLNGGWITNPVTVADQGISAAEYLYVDIVTDAVVGWNGTTVALAPGQSFFLVVGQTTKVSCNATTLGHRFSGVVY